MEFLLVLVIVGALGALIAVSVSNSEAKKDAANAYRKALSLLKQSPGDPHLRESALNTGRHYANLTRNSKGVAIFDEVALANDINAACAATSMVVQERLVGRKDSTSEHRIEIRSKLTELKVLADEQLISQQEYEKARAELLFEFVEASSA